MFISLWIVTLTGVASKEFDKFILFWGYILPTWDRCITSCTNSSAIYRVPLLVFFLFTLSSILRNFSARKLLVTSLLLTEAIPLYLPLFYGSRIDLCYGWSFKSFLPLAYVALICISYVFILEVLAIWRFSFATSIFARCGFPAFVWLIVFFSSISYSVCLSWVLVNGSLCSLFSRRFGIFRRSGLVFSCRFSIFSLFIIWDFSLSFLRFSQKYFLGKLTFR